MNLSVSERYISNILCNLIKTYYILFLKELICLNFSENTLIYIWWTSLFTDNILFYLISSKKKVWARLLGTSIIQVNLRKCLTISWPSKPKLFPEILTNYQYTILKYNFEKFLYIPFLLHTFLWSWAEKTYLPTTSYKHVQRLSQLCSYHVLIILSGKQSSYVYNIFDSENWLDWECIFLFYEKWLSFLLPSLN